MKEKDIKYLNGKNIEVYIGPTDSEDEYDSLDYRFTDGSVYYGIGFISDDLNDVEINDFSKDEDLKEVFNGLYDDNERFVLNIVLNLISKQIERDDFPDIEDAIVSDIPIYCIIMKDENAYPIVEDCHPNMSLGYFQSII